VPHDIILGYARTMRGAEFRVRALHEGKRYGEDRLVFLRELAQNSRDASARHISVHTSGDDHQLTIDFSDDGSGMTFEHARRYLFTLYASSKEREAMSAGRFGVGFWSVLLAGPQTLSIESMTGKEAAWKLVLDGELDHPRLTPCSRTAPGTRVTVTIASRGRAETRRLIEDVTAALKRYCQFLRRNDRRGTPLPVELDGKPIGANYEIDGPLGLPFNRGPVEGVVGLGSRPRVELYARGLPVWKGTVLDELRYGASRSKRAEHPEGLAPVYILGGNELNVTLDRRAVIDDPSLERVRRTARLAMRELLSRYLGAVASQPLGARVVERISSWIEEIRLGGHLPALLGLSLILSIVVGVLLAVPRLDRWLDGDQFQGSNAPSIHAKAPHAPSSPPPLRKTSLGNPRPFSGPVIDTYSTEQMTLAYRPAGSLLLRLAAYEQLDSGRGMLGAETQNVSALPSYRCPASCTDVRVELKAAPGLVVIPTPTGQLVDPGSVRLDGEKVTSLGLSATGEPLLSLTRATSGVLEYRTGPAEIPLSNPRRRRLVSVPGPMELPEELSRATSRLLGTTADKVAQLERLVTERLEYDRSLLARRAYAKFFATKPRFGWLDFVLTYGRGDCDVKNTMLVVLLRKAGVPARLAVGVVGRKGRVVPGAHAWVEYHDGGWHRADASGTERRRAGVEARPSPLITSEEPPQAIGSPKRLPSFLLPWPDREWLTVTAVVAGSLALLSASIALILLILGSRRAKLIGPTNEEERREIAAKMLANALAHPKAWRLSGEVTEQRLLPILGSGHPMSLAEALHRARRGALYFSQGATSLAGRVVAARARVLDSSDEAFGSLITSLPGIVDLDAVTSLRPTRPTELGPDLEDVARLVGRINELIERAGLPRDLIVACPGLEHARTRDVDLSRLIPQRRLDSWGRFVALQPRTESFRRFAREGRDDIDLAAFEALQLILSDSDLLRHHGDLLRRTAGRAIFEEGR